VKKEIDSLTHDVMLFDREVPNILKESGGFIFRDEKNTLKP
jgi:hypothetical protein